MKLIILRTFFSLKYVKDRLRQAIYKTKDQWFPMCVCNIRCL